MLRFGVCVLCVVCLCLNKKRNKLFFCVYVSCVFMCLMCIQQQLTTLKNNDLLFLLFCLCCLYCLYSVYTYKQQQTPKILFSLFLFFSFASFLCFFVFSFFFHLPPRKIIIRPYMPKFVPSFSHLFLRFFYAQSTS